MSATTRKPASRKSARPANRAELARKLARAALPTFSEVFGRPSEFPQESSLYEAYRAANRVYHSRRDAYEQRAASLRPEALLSFIVKDVLEHLPFIEERKVAFIFTVRRYCFLDPKKFRLSNKKAVEEAEKMVSAFARVQEKKLSIRLALLRGVSPA